VQGVPEGKENCHPLTTFKVYYLTTLRMWILCSFGDRIINECRAVSGMRISRGTRSTRGKHSAINTFSIGNKT
jgi:hypothetical protein